MNIKQSVPNSKQGNQSWLKGLLSVLLLFLVLGGLAGTVFFFLHSGPSGTREALTLEKATALSEWMKENWPGRKSPDFSFQGTLIGEQGAIAMINDQMISEGDEINSVRILKIGTTNIVVRYQEKIYNLGIGNCLKPESD